MEFKRLQTLKIDREFKNLIRPLRKREYLQLEQNLIAYGCIDPIITWNGYIIDGHNRYDICHRHNIPFTTLAMEFSCREEAIAWICANQLGRRNITEETRRFLIGMQYESEKIVNSKKNAQGVNQYSEEGSEIGSPEGDVTHPSEEWSEAPSGHKTAQRIAEENHISWNTVQKYAIYTRALEAIGQKVPDLVPKILSGRYKISHKNIVELSMLTPAQIQKVVARIESDEQPFVRYKRTRQEISESTGEPAPPAAPSIKDMPQFDPDAEVNSLALTVPSWSSLIEKTRAKANLNNVTEKAKGQLSEALFDLLDHIDQMLDAMKED